MDSSTAEPNAFARACGYLQYSRWATLTAHAAEGGAGTVLVVVLWMMLFPGLRHLDKLSDLQVEGARTAD